MISKVSWWSPTPPPPPPNLRSLSLAGQIVWCSPSKPQSAHSCFSLTEIYIDAAAIYATHSQARVILLVFSHMLKRVRPQLQPYVSLTPTPESVYCHLQVVTSFSSRLMFKVHLIVVLGLILIWDLFVFCPVPVWAFKLLLLYCTGYFISPFQSKSPCWIRKKNWNLLPLPLCVFLSFFFFNFHPRIFNQYSQVVQSKRTIILEFNSLKSS